ncbi:hypothetical protein ID866_7213 [Astraeus odoratus]|nr:hypothetical protein ID866_7213 [Astraeus odoratus]
MYDRYSAQGALEDLEEAISLYQQALDLCPVGHINRSLSLFNLACCIHSRHRAQGALVDLEHAFSLNQQLLELHPVGHPKRGSVIISLATCMVSRYESQGAIEDLEEAISLRQQALELHPVGHPNRSSCLSDLAACIQCRYKLQGVGGDLENAISLHQKALKLSPIGDPNRSVSLTSLGNCMESRYESQGTLEDLEEAICLHQQALELRPVGHPNRSVSLGNLANCIKSRYESQKAFGDLEVAISLHQQALELRPVGHPHRLSSLACLANCIQSKYESQGALGDLEEAICLYQQALEFCPMGHPNRSSSILNLANCMQSRYQSQGALGDLEEAISLHKQALDTHSVDHSGRASSLLSLGSCLQSRYDLHGLFGDLEEAISLYQQALELHPVGHPNRSLSLGNLANCMQSRYKSQGALKDLDEAIFLQQQALELCPVGHSNRSSLLRRLANSIQTRYELHHALGDLEEATSLHQQSLELHPVGHPNRVLSLGNLAICMQARYESQGALTDLEEAISLHQQALELCSIENPNRPSSLCNLANCLHSKFESQGSLGDLEQAISMYQANQLINDLIQETLYSLPPRLLQAHTGILFTQNEMVSQFQESTQYQTLVILLENVNDWHSTISHMQKTIVAYFQYVTLSHRWELNEPLLEDILHNGSIYDMPPKDGLTKLQRFCHTAAGHGYSWAWSDTCCIDKTNSVELQKAISSMFSCIWFTRGWTLQELLAPHTILLYTKEWSLYMNSTATNHKQDARILNQLAQAAGIPPQHISNFHAGMDSARSRLEWAVCRDTTVWEDTAYSLYGIFNLHLPVLYGEGKEKALGRLLQEILSQSHDISILHWVGQQSSIHSCFPTSIQAYQSLPRVQPEPIRISNLQAIYRLQQVVSADTARSFYNVLTSLPQPRFADYILTLPCIVHRIQVVKLRQVCMDHHTYDVQAVGLRPVQIITPERLIEAGDPPNPLLYVLIRPWDRRLLNYLEEDHVMAGYKALMELEQPFIALMLMRLPEGEYRRICASRHIIVRPDGPTSVVNSDIATLDIA